MKQHCYVELQWCLFLAVKMVKQRCCVLSKQLAHFSSQKSPIVLEFEGFQHLMKMIEPFLMTGVVVVEKYGLFVA